MLINSVQLKSYKDNGINFEYVYKYSDEQSPFIRILFTRNDYSKSGKSTHK